MIWNELRTSVCIKYKVVVGILSFCFSETFDLDLADAAHRYKNHKKFADRRDQVYSARTYFYEGEEKCDKNTEIFLECIDTTGNTSENGFAAIKVTALGRPAILVNYRWQKYLFPRMHVFVQSPPWKHSNMFKVNNKDGRMTSLAGFVLLFLIVYC